MSTVLNFFTPPQPMLAVPLEQVEIRNWADWAIEVKFDGERRIVLKRDGAVRSWTRPRKHAGDSGKTMAETPMPAHLIEAFLDLPDGIYDGELMAGTTSTDVRRTDLRGTQRFVVFDVYEIYLAEGKGLAVQVNGKTVNSEGTVHVKNLAYDDRRKVLELIFSRHSHIGIDLAESHPLTCKADVLRFTEKIWRVGGEGSMLKRRAAGYQPGKRSKDVVKVKKIQHEVMEVIGFERGKGEKVDRGPFAMTKVRSLDGTRETSVKTLDDAELAAFHRDALCDGVLPADPTADHPALGRQLLIEFNDWTPKGGYRHPRWDHWVKE